MNLEKLGDGIRLIEIPWKEDWEEILHTIKGSHPSSLISVRLPLIEGAKEKALSLVREGVSIVHLEGSYNGRAVDDKSLFVKEALRSVHLALVEEGVRDEISLLVSGGLAMAEHVAKSMICGADAVFIDFPILIALECRMCRRCTKGLSCPVQIDQAPSSWVASRVVNLLGAWHNQLLEVMGAMGMRDARRLRGEVGRAMFFEDLDEATFGSMGKVEEGYELE
jgi:glutamate synthase domain-containing protein 2